ncbi:MAG: M1 family metallopeptidase [Cyclobacteriaceae bacterium]|nr:M1 family metallopeptidase [Cyclobacteriaceae bacterium]MDH5249530.1 M1 family metallopeptidase [Cyclobacteriaceae bacterium]
MMSDSRYSLWWKLCLDSAIGAKFKRALACAILILLLPFSSFAQYPINKNVDVQHYFFSIELTDSSNEIKGDAEISVLLKNGVKELILDLKNITKEGKGMKVERITHEDLNVEFSHKNDRLQIDLPAAVDGKNKIRIKYSGIPGEGFIISKNKYGDRTFFGDNYPDRARNWLPCVDHPSDKASVSWSVSAPDHYLVVGSGKLKEETNLGNEMKLTRWEMSTPISTKVMVIGVARFAVDYFGEASSTPIQTWVYPQNRREGFYDFAPALDVVNWFRENVGPYAYDKLANVQSKTTYGGMENASNIFYTENAVTGKREGEGLIVHEIAHQWFGNSATEADWPHAWLSEGFATYFTHLYNESTYGRDIMVAGLKEDRKAVIDYWKRTPLPVVNTSLLSFPTIMNLRELLSTNTYEKGGWILHMLRKKLGDKIFWSAIKAYYAKYMNGIATTNDFKAIAEQESGLDLTQFFKQWLYEGGQPELTGSWHYQKGEVQVQLAQVQDQLFIADVEIGIVDEHGAMTLMVVTLDGRSSAGKLKFQAKPVRVIIDPSTWLLYDGPGELTFEGE